jgi:hypothetical protein
MFGVDGTMSLGGEAKRGWKDRAAAGVEPPYGIARCRKYLAGTHATESQVHKGRAASVRHAATTRALTLTIDAPAARRSGNDRIFDYGASPANAFCAQHG